MVSTCLAAAPLAARWLISLSPMVVERGPFMASLPPAPAPGRGHRSPSAPADGLAETSQGMERVTVAVAPQAHRRKTELSAPPAGPPAPRRRASPSPLARPA